jgi:hypothetical protein
MKDLKDQVAPILTKIYTKSIETGTIPKDWKHANVAPAFKKGERYKAENYRPISLTCICCILMEHIITSNIMKHLDSKQYCDLLGLSSLYWLCCLDCMLCEG